MYESLKHHSGAIEPLAPYARDRPLELLRDSAWDSKVCRLARDTTAFNVSGPSFRPVG